MKNLAFYYCVAISMFRTATNSRHPTVFLLDTDNLDKFLLAADSLDTPKEKSLLKEIKQVESLLAMFEEIDKLLIDDCGREEIMLHLAEYYDRARISENSD